MPSRTQRRPQIWCFISDKLPAVIDIKHCFVIYNRIFITTHPLESYYLNHAGRIHSPFRGSALSILTTLTSARTWDWHFSAGFSMGPTHPLERGQGCGPRDVAYRRQAQSDMVENESREVSSGNIVSKHDTESTQRLFNMLRSRVLKRVRETGWWQRDGRGKLLKERAF